MAEIVNLRRARKQRDRAAREDEAARNRQRTGIAKAVKGAGAAERQRADKALDQHRRADDESAGPSTRLDPDA